MELRPSRVEEIAPADQGDPFLLGPSWDEVAQSVLLAPRFAEDAELQPLAATDDGAALYFTRSTPDEALLRWTLSGAEDVLFRVPAGSALSGAAPDVGGRPRSWPSGSTAGGRCGKTRRALGS